MTFLLNLLCALIFFCLGKYFGIYLIAYYIVDTSEAEIIAEIKRIKQILKEEGNKK